MTTDKAYKSHKPGSRKSKVHEAFDKKGSEVAWTLGIKLKLKEGTLRSWFGAWQRDKASKPAKKSPTKKPTLKITAAGNATTLAS